jgi:hypothetical protein
MAAALRKRICLTSVIGFVVVLVACSPPTTHTPVPTPAPVPAPAPALITVTVSGRVLDVDREAMLSGAVVRMRRVTSPGLEYHPDPSESATTDETGAFRLVVTVPKEWTGLGLGITRDGYEPQNGNGVIPQTVNKNFTLLMYPTLNLRPGETISTRVHLGEYSCGEEFVCRRIVVGGSPDAPVDIELIPMTGSGNVGLFLQPISYGYQGSFPHHITVTSSEVWVGADFDAQVTLTATRR